MKINQSDNMSPQSKVDARGLSCPQPVILARKAIEAGRFPIEVLVETVTSFVLRLSPSKESP